MNQFDYSKTRYPLKVSTEHLTVYDQYDICADGIRKERQPETWTFSVSLRAF